MSGHYCKRVAIQGDWMNYPMDCLAQQCGECGAWEALHLVAYYEGTLKFNDEVRTVRGSMLTEPLQTGAEPHEGHQACQKRFSIDAHTIASMGHMLNEAEVLIYELQMIGPPSGLADRCKQWSKRWAHMCFSHEPSGPELPQIICGKHGRIGSPDGSCPKCSKVAWE